MKAGGGGAGLCCFLVALGREQTGGVPSPHSGHQGPAARTGSMTCPVPCLAGRGGLAPWGPDCLLQDSQGVC